MTQNNKMTKPAILEANTTDPCVHCGFCLPTCASYRVLGTEMDSPRGRIHTFKAIANNEIQMDSTVASHFDTCLGCFACVTACPSSVRYDQLIEAIRPQLNKPGLRSSCNNLFRKLLLLLLPYPKRLRAILQVMRGYAGTSIQKKTHALGLTKLFGPQLQAMEALLPPLSKECFADNFPVINKPHGKRRGRVGLVLGCVQRCFDPNVNLASLLVLQANGFEVVIPKDQGCCGAVTHHQGELKHTQELAEKLITSFHSISNNEPSNEEQPIEAILVAASGCGHTMKAYNDLLSSEKGFKVPVLDIHEFLILKGLSEEFKNRLKPLNNLNKSNQNHDDHCNIVFHDACHMIHGQGIAKQPRNLLKSIPNIEITEATEAGVCCGSAGIYNIVQPQEAKELGQIKTKDLLATKPEIIASANIGCTLQLRQYVKSNCYIAHPMEILASSAGLQKFPSKE